jgi:hypothetical protein
MIYPRIKFVGTMAGFFAVAMAFFPAVAPTATTVDLQSRIVDLQRQSIVMTQTQMDRSGPHIRILGQTELKGVSDVTITETVPNQAASNSTPMQIAGKRGARHSPYPGVGTPGSCLPHYHEGPGFNSSITGRYQSRGIMEPQPYGGLYVSIQEEMGKVTVAGVTADIWNAVGNFPVGTRVTLFGKAFSKGYSATQFDFFAYCIELAAN